MSLTCPQHRSKGPDAHHRSKGGLEVAYQGYPGAAEDPGYADNDMLNGDAARPRNLDRSGEEPLQSSRCNGLPVMCYSLQPYISTLWLTLMLVCPPQFLIIRHMICRRCTCG